MTRVILCAKTRHIDSEATGTQQVATDPRITPANIASRFVKGDPRINRKGRPKSFDHFRELAQEVAGEELTRADGTKITVAEALLRKCAKSDEPALIRTFFEYAFGKVPDKLETNALQDKPVLILHYAHERNNNGQN